jgi:hypothetical protein
MNALMEKGLSKEEAEKQAPYHAKNATNAR